MRKYICITYHMAKLDGETAETCIDLPMDEKIADDILRAQRDSRYVKDAAWPIASILQNLAKLQGYDSSAFCMAEKSNLYLVDFALVERFQHPQGCKLNACFLCGDGHLAAYRADILAVMRFQLRGIVDISHADDVLNRHKFCQSQFIIREGRGRNSKGFRCPLSAG